MALVLLLDPDFDDLSIDDLIHTLTHEVHA